MNGTNKESGLSRADSPNHQSGTQISGGPGKDDPKKLVSVIEENRAKIDKGWEELNKLDQMLNRMDQLLELRANQRRRRSAEATAAPATNRAPAITQAA
jgi:hypothetical protein